MLSFIALTTEGGVTVVGPRPKRRDYWRSAITGKYFAQEAYDNAVGDWERRRDEERSTWTPRAGEAPDVGVVEGTDDIVSFKTGGPSGKETLISDGDYSDDNDGFRTHHDHHGPARSTRRGRYTGPGS